MGNLLSVKEKSCKKCGLCMEVCPNRIIAKESTGKISYREDRAHLCFRCGQCMAVCPAYSINVTGLSYEEDFFELPEKASQKASFEGSFYNLIASRRAIRNFKDKPVPRDLLEKIVQAISFAPPGFPPLKTEIIVVQNTEVIRKALPYMIETYNFLVNAVENPIIKFFIRMKIGREKFATVVNHVVPLMKIRLPELKKGTEDTITRNAPAMILFHADKNSDNYREDINIALTYGFLAAHALGLGGSAMSLIPPAIERNKELRKMFSIPDTNEVTASMIIGYPKYSYKRGIKRELKSVKWI